MKGQQYKMNIWESRISNFSMYDNFTFPTMYSWDDFYYDNRNKRLINSN